MSGGRIGGILGLIGACIIIGVYAINGAYKPKPQPTPTPTVPTVTVYLPNCEDGTRQAGIACVTFDEGLMVLSNDTVSVPLPVTATEIGGRYTVTLPACHREEESDCVWTGAPDGKPGSGTAFIDLGGRLFNLTPKQLFG